MKDLIRREAAIREIARFAEYLDEDMILRIQKALKRIPPEQLVDDTCYEDLITWDMLFDKVM